MAQRPMARLSTACRTSALQTHHMALLGCTTSCAQPKHRFETSSIVELGPERSPFCSRRYGLSVSRYYYVVESPFRILRPATAVGLRQQFPPCTPPLPLRWPNPSRSSTIQAYATRSMPSTITPQAPTLSSFSRIWRTSVCTRRLRLASLRLTALACSACRHPFRRIHAGGAHKSDVELASFVT